LSATTPKTGRSARARGCGANPEGRWRNYTYEELAARNKADLDVFWLKDKSLTDLDNLPEPEQLAEEIIETLEAGLSSFRAVLNSLSAHYPR
jgi:type I restriction enzyme M protein